MGWISMHSVPEVRTSLVSSEVEPAWLTRYPLPNKIIVDRGKEFLAEFKSLNSLLFLQHEKSTSQHRSGLLFESKIWI